MQPAFGLEKLEWRLSRVAPTAGGVRRQSRRYEGGVDQDGECNRFPCVHVLVEQGIDGKSSVVSQVFKTLSRFQCKEVSDPYWVDLRGFPARIGEQAGTDSVRIEARYTASPAMFGKVITDVVAGAVPLNAHGRRPVPKWPGHDDLVLVLSHRLDVALPAEVLAFAAKAAPRRTLHIGLEDSSWVELRQAHAEPLMTPDQTGGAQQAAQRSDDMESFVKELNRQVCEALWAMDHEHVDANASGSHGSNLVWPGYRGKTARYSEQEARFAMALILSRDPLLSFSVETPTLKTYTFTGKKEISAQTDLTIFRRVGAQLERDLNVEFKAHQPAQLGVTKDMQKLLHEPLDGNWFHVIENTDKGTLQALFGKLSQAVQAYSREPLGDQIHFCFCCVRRQKGWFLTVKKTELLGSPETYFGPDAIAKGAWQAW